MADRQIDVNTLIACYEDTIADLQRRVIHSEALNRTLEAALAAAQADDKDQARKDAAAGNGKPDDPRAAADAPEPEAAGKSSGGRKSSRGH